jgi:hypothetical protein
MNRNKRILIGGALSAVLLAPGIASAGFVLDTGAPTGTTTDSELTTTQWFAAEFTLSGTESITSLSAYLNPLNSTSYTFDIYSGNAFTTTRVGSLSVLDTVSATYTTSGWNTTSTNFTLGPGTYWVALEMTGSGRGPFGLDLPGTGISTTSGTAPAQGFAFYSSTTGGVFTTSNAPGIGIEITGTGSPVPLPGAIWLLGSGLAALGAMRRRRS